ncbi:hypothetical protein H2200_007920 [Cladophialophora chaetospira]|uniref:DNA replication regulator Sld3 C-terminal domain-containing protein n=1 Tax=Cladophialophora chaetospira TaxID=386627 RepID=A0AA39CGJ1_9EURO|nr:hypothetical protein H2200_007920 [Cladophialophora chaetospira]
MQSLLSLPEQRQRLVLSPTTDNSLNVASNTTRAAPSRKRKSSDLEDDSNEYQQDSFAAKLLSNKGAVTFAPVTLVARACLPLAWLNTWSASSSLVFQAAIPTVEEWEQRALIVRKVPNGSLYAIERVAADTFCACPLQSWVSETWCLDAALGKIADVNVEDLLPTEGHSAQRTHSRTASGSSSTALPTLKSPKRPKNRRGALARMSILALKDPMDNLAMTADVGSPVLIQQSETVSIGHESPCLITSPALVLQPSIAQQLVQEPDHITPGVQNISQNTFAITDGPNEIEYMDSQPLAVPVPDTAISTTTADTNPLGADRLRTQYFEHLYTSKTSLAFYVKGPLARARAHVRTAENASTTIRELTDFYVESILPTKKVDLKYKESISKTVKELPVQQQEDGADVAGSKKKKPRKKKMKLGKDGLWPEEEDFVAKWWRGREIKGTVSGSDQADEMRKEVADLRMRETKMQLLLILEVMLLETAASTLAESEKPANPADPKVKVESVEEDSTTTLLATTPRKQPKKKKRDWSAELDTIVDRLCIWHTVSLDDLLNSSDNQSSKKDANGSTASKPNDSLRDFCKDVLLPFYSAKLPVQVKAVCRKLGGLEVSPQRPQPARPAVGLHRSSSSMSSFLKAKPGQPLTTRTLERVLSEDHRLLRHATPPTTFSRASSISAPIIPTLKREPSERPISRGGMLSKSVSFSNREIDLVADQKVHEAKRRKLDRLAQQKKELEAAIDALKKPDRKTVASQIMDEAEERKRLEREKLAVQISATPKARRVKGQSQMDEPELPPMPMPRLMSRQQEAPMVIPSSSIKPRPKSGLSSSASAPRSSAMKMAVLAAIHETPSRGLGRKTSNPLDLPRLPETSADADELVAITATPAPRYSRHETEALPSSGRNLSSSQPRQTSSQITDTADGLLMKRSRRPVLFTPLKKADVRLDQVFRDAPEIPEQAGRMMDRVMGGKGIDEGFEPPLCDPVTVSKKSRGVEPGSADIEDGDIYDKLGWNDDFDL